MNSDMVDIDLLHWARVLWRQKVIILGCTGLAAIAIVVFAVSLPNYYRASTLMAPVETGGALGGLARQYGGLASLAGVAIPGGGNDKSDKASLAIELMTSRKFVADFVERRKFSHELIAFERWDSTNQRVITDDELYDHVNGEWLSEPDTGLSYKPSRLEIHRAFTSILQIQQSSESEFVTVSMEHQSPELASKWLAWLIADVDAHIRLEDVTEARQAIEYLQNQIESTSLTDLRAVFFELIQAQLEKMMLAELRSGYVFKVIDPPVTPEIKSKPNRALICIGGTFLGFLFGCLLVIAREFFESNEH